jgi:hypothetical protein
MRSFTRRRVLAVLGAGGVVGLAYALRNIVDAPVPRVRLTDGHGFGGTDSVDMSRYMEMFARHQEISRTVDEIPGGVRTSTESNVPELAAELQEHVSTMYARLDQGVEVMCMSPTLPSLFRKAGGYRRQLTFTPTGVIAEETADDPAITEMIRAHAREVTGFVRDGMPAMMQQMLGPGGMMGPGGMGPHHR